MGRPRIPTLRHGGPAMQPPRLRGTGPLFAVTRLAALAKAVCLTALQGRHIALAASFCHLGPKSGGRILYSTAWSQMASSHYVGNAGQLAVMAQLAWARL